MNSIEDLPSGEIRFVDSDLDSAFDNANAGERVSVMLIPFCKPEKFVSVVNEDSFGVNCKQISTKIIRIDLTRIECDLLLTNNIIKKIELVRPNEHL